MRWINKFNEILVCVERFLVLTVFSALVLLVFFNILSRNLFHVSFQIILEIAPGLVLWVALLGSTLALNESRHIKLDLLLRFTPENVRVAATILTSVFGMLIMGILFRVSLGFVKNELAIFGAGGGFGFIFPVFFAIAFLRYGIRLLRK